ncbi:Pyrophosphatase PpaX [Lysinibacillus sphaericus]
MLCATLEQLKSMGIKLAIVSTKRNAMIDRGLKFLGASHLFEVIVGTDDVQHVKPDPEPVLLGSYTSWCRKGRCHYDW